MRHDLVAAPGVADRRLDVFLADELGLSRSVIQRLVKGKAVAVNGAIERSSYLVVPGDTIIVDIPVERRDVLPAPDLTVVYEDETIVVIDKPAGISVHPGSGRPGQSTVADYARTISTDPDPERPGIVHRLDRDTSGLLVIAKTLAAKEYMQQQWQKHSVEKRYLLLAIGRLTSSAAVIKLPIGRDPAHPLQRTVLPGGRPAVTHYQTLLDLPGYSYLEARPETGRTHQLRVHFAALGHPIAGDVVYGLPSRPPDLPRQFLHASGLKFVSPNSKPVDLTSELPADLIPILERLKSGL